MSEAIVVLERGGALPAWVDEGGESSVWIVAQRSAERYPEFAARAILELSVIGGAARVGVLVRGPERRPEDAVDRCAIVEALGARMRPAGGRIVLVERAERSVSRAA